MLETTGMAFKRSPRSGASSQASGLGHAHRRRSGPMLLLSQPFADQQRFSLPRRTEFRVLAGLCVRIEAVGERWSLEIPDDSFDFRHDGSGIVEMSRGRWLVQWRPVTSQWGARSMRSAGTDLLPGSSSARLRRQQNLSCS